METGTKRIAVLAPGPSLAVWRKRGDAPKDYGAVIAVNRAINEVAVPADPLGPSNVYWIMLDAYTFELCEPQVDLDQLTIVSHTNEWERMCEKYPGAERCGFIALNFLTNALGSRLPVGVEWRVFTVTVAVAMAVHLEATEIDLFGVDQTGTKDWDGKTDPRYKRSRQRWEREKRIWAKLMKHLGKLGITVQRMGTGDSECQALTKAATEPVAARSI